MFAELLTTLGNTQLTVPAIELMLLILLLTLALLFRYTRTGIVVAYLFSYRWAWGAVGGLGDDAYLWYLIFGCSVGVLSVLGLCAESKS